jgi:acetyl-CoA synthetase
MAKGIVHAHRYLLAHQEFTYCHEVEDGERFHGMGEWAWAAGIAPLLGPWRLGALQCVYQREGGFDPHKQLDFLSRHEVTNVFTTPTAMRAMMAVEGAGEKHPQKFRRVCSAGEPLNPEAIRWFRDEYGVTVLDYYGLTESYPLCANYPFMDVREGSMGKPMPGWDVAILDEDERPVAQGDKGEICLRARSNPHYPLGYWRNDEAAKETFGGEWFHSKDAASEDEDGYYWYEGRADDVIIAAGYRIGPFEVESACIEHEAVREGPANRCFFQRLAPLPVQASLCRLYLDPMAHHIEEVILAEWIERQPQAETVGQGDLVLYRLTGMQFAVDHLRGFVVAVTLRQQMAAIGSGVEQHIVW